jgi:hypothetical protein
MKASGPKIRFETELTTTDKKPVYHFLLVPKETAAPLGFTGNIRRVFCTVNDALTFQAALLPSGKNTRYYISMNKEKRDQLGIVPGDKVTVELRRDNTKYGLPMPAELREVLNQDAEGARLFDALTNGRQRTILYYVAKAKDVDRRIHAALVIVEHLKNNEGKIAYHKLYEELKPPKY